MFGNGVITSSQRASTPVPLSSQLIQHGLLISFSSQLFTSYSLWPVQRHVCNPSEA